MNNLFLGNYILNGHKQFKKVFLIDDDDIDNTVFSVLAEKSKGKAIVTDLLINPINIHKMLEIKGKHA